MAEVQHHPGNVAFEQAMAKLNEQQRAAVQTIEGPVLVVAGPGTGKTQIIATRIAYMLHTRETQIQPYNILCLTYSEAAAVAMRRRLLEIIGVTAHQVTVETFHAFSNAVIQQNAEEFGMQQLQPITELQRLHLLEQLLEELPMGHRLRNPSGNLIWEARKLGDLFTLMKREDWPPQRISDAIDHYLESLPSRPEFVYQRNCPYGRKGEPKKAEIEKEREKMEMLRAAAGLFLRYEERKLQLGTYDYEDMILWVIDAFRRNELLLRKYQERYQYVLVDEFQDTNGSQNELLQLLTGYWEVPNLFCVGDDDQGIYEFQGARIKNINDFIHRYGDALTIVVLRENYRSTQSILDTAARVIANNTQRLSSTDARLEKQLKAVRYNEPGEPPRVVQYANTLQEATHIADQIEELNRQGIPYARIAVLYHRHVQGEVLQEQLQRRQLPIQVVRSINAFELKQVDDWIALLRYVAAEWQQPHQNSGRLYRVLHQPWFHLEPGDLALLAYHAQQQRHRSWRQLLNDTDFVRRAGLQQEQKLLQVHRCMEQWIAECSVLTVPILLDRIIQEAGILQWVLQQEDKYWHLQVLNTFCQFVRSQAAAAPLMTVGDLVDVLDQYARYQISLPVQRVLGDEEGVVFSTCHGAKGLEFEQVFLVGCHAKGWEKAQRGGHQYALPDTLTYAIEKNDTEALRRLFYVGCTRAQRGLQISFAATADNGSAQTVSQFVTETGLPVQTQKVDPERTANALVYLMTPEPGPDVPRLDAQYIRKRLESFVLSPSALSAYLDCPLRFYYDYILCVPAIPSESMEYGNAVHFALYRLFKTMKERHDRFPEEQEFLRFFDEDMTRRRAQFTERQFRNRMQQGHMVLSAYYRRYVAEWNKIVALEYNARNVQVNGVPLKGRMDKLEFDGLRVTVVDYKTGSLRRARQDGKLAPPSENLPYGGDYWRQMVFYKLLLDRQKKDWEMAAARFDFVDLPAGSTADDFGSFLMQVELEHERQVIDLITATYEKIQRHEFFAGCRSEDCVYCSMYYGKAYMMPVATEEYA